MHKMLNILVDYENQVTFDRSNKFMCIYALEAVTYFPNKVSTKLVSTIPYVIWKGLE